VPVSNGINIVEQNTKAKYFSFYFLNRLVIKDSQRFFIRKCKDSLENVKILR
jgi:hypothetical protein